MVYVDKTRHIHQLITNSRYCFLSRPRRFGKSLTLSTIEHIFRGEKELFHGLWIENNWDWTQTHPVIHVSFSKLDYQNLTLEGAIIAFLDERAAQSGLTLSARSAKGKLSELVVKLAAKESPVVLLIDEYDKPIIDYLDKDELSIASANRTTLKTLYSGLKDGEIQAALRFFMITGVSKF
ncbi:MAG: AAA family ATPase, partial [Bacteroidetes bacterium]